MPDRKHIGTHMADPGRQLPGRIERERKPGEIARDLDGRRDKLAGTVGDLKDQVMEKVETGRRAVMYVPDKIKQVGGASKRAGQRVGAFVRERPVTASAIGVGAIGAITGLVMARRRKRRHQAEAATRTRASAASGSKGSRSKTSPAKASPAKASRSKASPSRASRSKASPSTARSARTTKASARSGTRPAKH